jgi:hypothetical protein
LGLQFNPVTLDKYPNGRENLEKNDVLMSTKSACRACCAVDYIKEQHEKNGIGLSNTAIQSFAFSF